MRSNLFLQTKSAVASSEEEQRCCSFIQLYQPKLSSPSRPQGRNPCWGVNPELDDLLESVCKICVELCKNLAAQSVHLWPRILMYSTLTHLPLPSTVKEPFFDFFLFSRFHVSFSPFFDACQTADSPSHYSICHLSMIRNNIFSFCSSSSG